MNAPVLDLAGSSASTDIATIVAQTPVVVLVDGKQRASLYAHIEREIAAFVPDVSTAKGRDAIKALAFKVTRTKTAIDAAGKELNEEARTKINLVDEARRDARNTLDILAEKARKPLTDWEEAEKARAAECDLILANLKAAATVTLDDTAATVRERGVRVWNTALDGEKFGDGLAAAETVKAETVDALKNALARLTQEEADRAELEKLRAANEARETREREEAAARAEAERVAEEARLEAERQAEAERAEAERIANAEKAAAERAQREADERHAAEIAAERAKVAEAERVAQAERDRVAREAEEQAHRDTDKKHRTAVKTAAKEAMIALGCPDDAAVKIVLAIIAGEIPNVSLRF